MKTLLFESKGEENKYPVLNRTQSTITVREWFGWTVFYNADWDRVVEHLEEKYPGSKILLFKEE